MRNWETLRHEARRLEQDLEERLAGFSKLYHTLNGDIGGKQFASSVVQTTEEEIESLLGQLSSVVDSMEAHLSSSAAAVHVHRSHEDILREYRVEFKRTQAKVRALADHRELLRDGPHTRNKNGATERGATGDGALQSEWNHLTSATGAADSAINTGWSIQEDLKRQRALFDSMMNTMDQVRGSVPAIGTLVESIKRKRKRDLIVLAAVIATGIFLTLLWSM